MDLLKTKIYLDKLHREYARMSKDPDNVVRIDVDIMLSYVRELYDAILSEAVTKHDPPPVVRKQVITRAAQPEESPSPVAAEPPRPAAPPVQPPVEMVVTTTPTEEKPVPAAPPPVVVEARPEPATEAKPPNAAHHAHSSEAEALFEEKQAKELSEKLSELPIADLKRAIALNDRLLLTRELFAGDGQAFETTISALNGYKQFSDAKEYLLNHCVIRYGWLDKKRVEAAKNFIKLVRRRYK